MNRITVCIALALVAAPLAAAVPDIGLPAAPAGPTRYLVGFHDVVPDDVRRGTPWYGATVLAVDHDLVLAHLETALPAVFEAQARQDDRVRYVELDDPMFARLLFVPNDALYGDSGHYGSKKIGAEAAWDVTRGSSAVKVGMLDSGIYRTHEDVAGARLLQGHDFYNGDTDPDDTSGCSWHGSHTTGTAGATIDNAKGIAGMSQHTILPVKAFQPSFFGCGGSTSALVNGLKYIADQGSHVSSNSWGSGSSSSSINDAITYAHNKGVIHVGAAGNSGPCTNCVGQPWKDMSAITIVVAASDSADKQASFSSEGPQVDVAAPGVGILSLQGGGNNYGKLSGTSMATPHVAGAAALMKAKDSAVSFTKVDDCLKSTALDLGASGKDDDFGYGRIRADQALACVGGGTTKAQCEDGVDNDGDGKVDHPNDPGCDSATDDDETDAAPPPGESRVYYEDVDDGSAQGWTKSSSSDLWHIEDGCVSDRSAPYKFAWTRASFCNYDTGSRVTNWAQSGSIGLSGKSQATLKFVHRFDIEQYSGGAYDILRVQVSKGCTGTWTTLQQWDSRGADVSSWTAVSYDIDAHAGSSLCLRFWTDTVDSVSNAHAGWYIDDVEVTAS